MATFQISVDTWSGVTMSGAVEADSLFNAARKAQGVMGGNIHAVRVGRETVAYRLARTTDAARRDTHGKTEYFAIISHQGRGAKP